MSEQPERPNSIKEEFKLLGENLKEAVQSAWESDTRQQVQQEMEAGLTELGHTLNEILTDIRESDTGKQILTEVDEIGEKLRSGEMAEKAGQGLVSVLKKINQELTTVIEQSPETEEGE